MPKLSDLVENAKTFKSISKRLETLNKKFPNEIKGMVSRHEGKVLVWKGLYKSFNKDLSSKLMDLKKVDAASEKKEIDKIDNIVKVYKGSIKAATDQFAREGEFIKLPISEYCYDLDRHLNKIESLTDDFKKSSNKPASHKKIKDWVTEWNNLKKVSDKAIDKDFAVIKKGLIGNSKPVFDLLLSYQKKASGAQFSVLKLLSGITPDKVSSRAREVRMNDEIDKLIIKHDVFVGPIVIKLESFFERDNELYKFYVDVFDSLKAVCLDFKRDLDLMVDE